MAITHKVKVSQKCWRQGKGQGFNIAGTMALRVIRLLWFKTSSSK